VYVPAQKTGPAPRAPGTVVNQTKNLEGKFMSTENKSVARRLVEEIWNKGNLNLADELLSSDYRVNQPTDFTPIRSREDFKKYVNELRTAFPDIRFTIEDQIAEGDKVLTRCTSRGTHKGVFHGIQPTNKSCVVTSMALVRFVNGKATEAWVEIDGLGLMEQIGVVPKFSEMPRKATAR
jgi:steroid delta-isomerase-like uncharacterized protein